MPDVAIEQQVRDIICEKLSVKPEQITPLTSFINDLGADSLDTVELVMEFEDKFGMQIPDEEAEKILTVGDAVRYIEDHRNSQAPRTPQVSRDAQVPRA